MTAVRATGDLTAPVVGRGAAYAEGFRDGCALVTRTLHAAHRPHALRSWLRRGFVFGLLVLPVLMLPVILL